jgi:hypothetical protein
MRQARPREHAAGRPRAGACRGPRGQAGAGRGALSSPVMGWTLQAAGGTSEGEASAARCPSGEPLGELRRRRAGIDQAAGRVYGVRNANRGGRYLKYRPPLGPLCPSDGRCAGQIIVCGTREPSSSPGQASGARGSWMAECP